jgi:hydroxymethylpyrimidine kinase / phosphomethylpyrimidine kinase / thiamine-phosphate diphosphorylase
MVSLFHFCKIMMPYILTIAGHDPVHGAGITADLATWAAMGLEGASVVTALTVQNSHGLLRVEPVAAATLKQALQAVVADGEPAAIKIGMLGSAVLALEVAQFVAARSCPVVFDTVMSGSNGVSSFDAQHIPLESVRTLMRYTDVITPNLPEAHFLLKDQSVSLSKLRALCRGAVVLKGGHGQGVLSVDQVYDGQRTALLSNPRWPNSVHGTGCVFSAALAGGLAQGWDVFDAAVQAKLWVHGGIHQARSRPGRAQVNAAPVLSSRHLPALRWDAPPIGPFPAFAPPIAPLGFYPVVHSADWVERLLTWGVRTVQLRIKAGDMPCSQLRREIGRAVRLGAQYPDAQVFINDHWRDALELKAYGVHLGQEDLAQADLPALQAAGLRLGVSSHTPLEMAFAHAVQPSYVALGPVYPTTLKAMHYDSVGLAQLERWTRWYHPRYPVVAIGGISLARAAEVWKCGVDGLAVVSAVTAAAQPEAAVRQFLSLCRAATYPTQIAT